MLKSNLTITRIGILEDEHINIELEDKNSSFNVVKIEISLENLMRALTNVSSQECDYELNAKNVEKLGKKREVKEIYMDRPKAFYKDEIKKEVIEHFKNLGLSSEWSIFRDGTSSRQDGTQYKYLICRYI